MDLLNSNRETCRQREREAAVKRDILATGCTDNGRDGQTRTEPILSASAPLLVCLASILRYLLFPWHTHVLDTLNRHTIIMHSIEHKHL